MLYSSGTGIYLFRSVCVQKFATGANKQYQNISNNILVIYLAIWLIYESSVTSANVCSLLTVEFKYFSRTTIFMLRILFRINFLLNAGVLQINTAVLLILHSLNKTNC